MLQVVRRQRDLSRFSPERGKPEGKRFAREAFCLLLLNLNEAVYVD